MKLGDFLKKHRINKSLLQRELASMVDVDPAYICKMENNEKIPKRDLLILLSNRLDIKKDQIIALWLKEKILAQLEGERYYIEAIELLLEEIKFKPGSY